MGTYRMEETNTEGTIYEQLQLPNYMLDLVNYAPISIFTATFS